MTRISDGIALLERGALRALIATALIGATATAALAQAGGGGAGGGGGAAGGAAGAGGGGGAGGAGGGGAAGRAAAAPAGPRAITNGVLNASSTGAVNRVPMTAQDSLIQQVVGKLSFPMYKDSLIRGLTQFGDRRSGTPNNAAAIDWIEAKLKSYGYTTERVHYTMLETTRRPDGRVDSIQSPREEVFATKIGTTMPQEMVIVSGHMDGIGNGEAANDNGSGTALVMEIARVLSLPGVQTDRSVRFALWNNEETGLDGAEAYVNQRKDLQGIENPRGSGRYPEPKWIALIQHDKVLFDHGHPVQQLQVNNADVDVEFQLNSQRAAESAQLGIAMINANRVFATDYPATLSNSMSNTDSTPFMDLVASVSVRENRRLYEIGFRGPAGQGSPGSDPNWHQETDIFARYSDADFRLGFNAMQMTLSATLKMVGVRLTRPLLP